MTTTETFDALLEDEAYQAIVVKHFLYFRFDAINPFGYKSIGEYNRAVNDNDLRTSQGELVKGYQELLIANFLYQNGIDYRYEAKYRVNTRTLEFRQYQPDFYLPDYGIYIEHYGTDRNGRTAPFIDTDKYNEGIRWKRELHRTHNTICIETFHYEWTEGTLLEGLEAKLLEHQVELIPLSNDEILSKLVEDDQLSELSILLGKMLKLFKASNLDDSLFAVGEERLEPKRSLHVV